MSLFTVTNKANSETWKARYVSFGFNCVHTGRGWGEMALVMVFND